jgi:hypothetical protein
MRLKKGAKLFDFKQFLTNRKDLDGNFGNNTIGAYYWPAEFIPIFNY